MGEGIPIPVGTVDMLRARRQASLAFVKHFESVVRPSVEARLDSEDGPLPYSITVQAGQSPDSRVIEVMTDKPLRVNVQQAIRDDLVLHFGSTLTFGTISAVFRTGVVSQSQAMVPPQAADSQDGALNGHLF